MARAEVTGRKPTAAVEEADAYSVEVFCFRHGISTQLFYKYPEQMPELMRVGSRVLISKEAAAAWRQERAKAT